MANGISGLETDPPTPVKCSNVNYGQGIGCKAYGTKMARSFLFRPDEFGERLNRGARRKRAVPAEEFVCL